jgi:hypothetical protein
MTIKSEKWRRETLGVSIDNLGSVSYIQNFNSNLGKLQGSEIGYSVVAVRDIMPGEIIEETPVLIIDTTIEELNNDAKHTDIILKTYGIKYPSTSDVFENEGHPVILGLGNFLLYNKAEISNSEYVFNPTFNVFTIRAKIKINKGDTIVLPISLTNSNFGDTEMGCGCKNKRKKQQAKKEQQTKSKSTDTTVRPKFQSMVTGKQLDSIDITEKNE